MVSRLSPYELDPAIVSHSMEHRNNDGKIHTCTPSTLSTNSTVRFVCVTWRRDDVMTPPRKKEGRLPHLCVLWRSVWRCVGTVQYLLISLLKNEWFAPIVEQYCCSRFENEPIHRTTIYARLLESIKCLSYKVLKVYNTSTHRSAWLTSTQHWCPFDPRSPSFGRKVYIYLDYMIP